MIQKIIEAVARLLNEVFEDIDIYVEEMEQDTADACFFITQISADTKQGLSRTFSDSTLFSIIYFDDENELNKNKKRNEIKEKLLRLEYIMLDNGRKLRLDNKKITGADELQLIFEVNYRLIEITEWDKINTIIKEGTAIDG